MAKITPITEQFQHFLAEMKEGFWGDLYGRTQQAWKEYFERESERLRDRYSGLEAYQRRRRAKPDYRNGYYERDFVTRFGTIRLRIARTRKRNFLPPGLEKFQRRAPGAGAADPGSVSARHQHAPGGAGGGHAERRASQRADGFQADPRAGSGGAAVPSGAAS